MLRPKLENMKNVHSVSGKIDAAPYTYAVGQSERHGHWYGVIIQNDEERTYRIDREDAIKIISAINHSNLNDGNNHADIATILVDAGTK